jgi:hypothetical protein
VAARRRELAIAYILVFGAFAVPSTAWSDDRPSATNLVVHDQSGGCFHHLEKTTEYVLAGDSYVGTHQRFPRSYIDGLRSLILASHEDSSTLLDQLGITADEAARQRDTIYQAVRRWTPELPETLPSWAEPLFAFERVHETLRKEIAGPTGGSTTSVEFCVTLPGNPVISVCSEADRYWMLPWHVKAGDASWETYSLAISRALAVLSDPTGPNAPLLDGSRYWSQEIWGESLVWYAVMGDSINAAFSRNLCESLAGFDRAKVLFIVESTEIGNISPAPRSLFMHLKANSPNPVDAARWWNPIVENRPTCNWNDFLALHEACTNAAVAHVWLSEWKATAPTREISLDAVGTTGFADSNMTFEVRPTWEGLGLAGRPEFELHLYTSGWRATVYLGTEDPRALIMRSKLGSGAHWLDQLDIDAPWCLVVDRQGKYEKRRVITRPVP